MEPTDSTDAFARAPLGRYFAGPSFVVWCWQTTAPPALFGTTLWGAPTSADVASLLNAWRLFEHLDTYSIVTDARRFERFDPTLFGPVLEYAQTYGAAFEARLVRHAMLLPESIAGVAMGGLYSLAGITQKWQRFDAADEAFAWASPSDGSAAHASIATLSASARNENSDLAALRQFLRSSSTFPPIAIAAAAIDRSSRSLQRALTTAGTTYRDELDHARVELAKTLLIDGELKIEAIAARVGCNHASSLTRVFRRVTGQAPGEFRAATRK